MDYFSQLIASKYATQSECNRPTAPDHPLTWVPDVVEFVSIFGPSRVKDSLIEYHEQKIEMRQERFLEETQVFERCQTQKDLNRWRREFNNHRNLQRDRYG